MDEPYVFVSDWATLEAASPETVAATTRAWYTVPRARKSGFYESEMPEGGSTAAANIDLHQYLLPFLMVELAKSEHYAHLGLDDLADEAEQYIAERSDAEKRKRALETHLVGHDALTDAYGKGMDSVYTLAKLSESEQRVAQYMMTGSTDVQIMQAMGYTHRQSATGVMAKISKKLAALTHQEAA